MNSIWKNYPLFSVVESAWLERLGSARQSAIDPAATSLNRFPRRPHPGVDRLAAKSCGLLLLLDTKEIGSSFFGIFSSPTKK